MLEIPTPARYVTLAHLKWNTRLTMFDISTVYIFSSIITPNSSWKNIHWLVVELWTILEKKGGKKPKNNQTTV